MRINLNSVEKKCKDSELSVSICPAKIFTFINNNITMDDSKKIFCIN